MESFTVPLQTHPQFCPQNLPQPALSSDLPKACSGHMRARNAVPTQNPHTSSRGNSQTKPLPCQKATTRAREQFPSSANLHSLRHSCTTTCGDFSPSSSVCHNQKRVSRGRQFNRRFFFIHILHQVTPTLPLSKVGVIERLTHLVD